MSHDVIVGLLLAVTLVVSVSFLIYCLRNEEKRGSTPLSVLFTGISCWVLADTIHIVFVETNGDPMVAGGLLIRVLGIELTAIGMLFLGLSYTARDHLISIPTVAVLSIKPVVVLGLVLSPYRTAVFDTVPADVPLGYEFTMTPLFLAHISYSYGVALFGAVLLGTVMIRSPSRYRLQSIALFLAVGLPVTVSLLFQIGILPFDLTPVSFAGSGILLTVSAFRFRLLDTIPVARQRVLNEMDDTVIGVDDRGQIVMCNSAATDLFGSRESLLGTEVQSLFDAEDSSTLERETTTEVPFRRDGEVRILSCSRSETDMADGSALDTVLVCRDITDQRRRQERLRRREEELQLLKDLQSRFLRHNLRNELNVIRTNAELLAHETDTPAEPYEEVMERTSQLLNRSEEARSLAQLVDTRHTVACEVNERIRAVIESTREGFPHVRFETDLTEGIRITAVPQIEQAIETLVDNAARYNTSPNPTVRIVTERVGERAVVCIADDGPGIDPDVVDELRGNDRQIDTEVGFGLWIADWIVEKSGGDISFESDDSGTTVELSFELLTRSEAGETVTA